MDLRPELTPPVISPERWEEIRRRIKEINYLVEDLKKEASDEIEEFNRVTGRSYDRHQFRKYWTVQSLEEFATDASRPDPKPVPNVTIDELIEVVRRAMPRNGNPDFEYYAAIFNANVPLPNASNLIYYPLDYDAENNTWGSGRPMCQYDPTPEEIVRQALARTKVDR